MGISGFRAADRQLAEMAFGAWSRESGGALKFIEAQDEDNAIVRLEWVGPASGLFGQTRRIRVNGKSGAVVFVMPDVNELGRLVSDLAFQDILLRDAIVYLTCVHELGHAVGLQHTDTYEDIMYSFGFGGDPLKYFLRYRDKLSARTDIPKFSGLSAADVEALQHLYKH